MLSPTSRVEHKRRSLLDAKAVSASVETARFPTAPTNRESERRLTCKILTQRTATRILHQPSSSAAITPSAKSKPALHVYIREACISSGLV